MPERKGQIQQGLGAKFTASTPGHYELKSGSDVGNGQLQDAVDNEGRHRNDLSERDPPPTDLF